MGVIQLRNDQWENRSKIRSILRGIQTVERISELFGNRDIPELESLADFALDCLPVAGIAEEDGDVTAEYEAFLDGIREYSLDEFYDRAILLKGFTKDDRYGAGAEAAGDAD